MSFFNTPQQTHNFLNQYDAKNQLVPVRSGMPHFVDSHFTNTVDFHVAATDLGIVVDDYANELAVALMWDNTFTTHDPITKQAELFANLNNSLPLAITP